MDKKLWFWLVWFLFLMILNFTIPFTVLRDVPFLHGSFLFWVIWAVVAIISMFVMFLGWRDSESSEQRGRS